MRYVLGVDPGPEKTAWLLWDTTGVDKKRFGHEPNDVVLEAIKAGHNDTVMAIEGIASYGMAVGREVFNTCYWIGRFMQAWPGPYELIYRQEVKLHLCGNVRARDPNVRQALIDKIGPPGSKTKPGATFGIAGDCWSALALAVTYAETKGKE